MSHLLLVALLVPAIVSNAIYTPGEDVTKPPKQRENLQWPSSHPNYVPTTPQPTMRDQLQRDIVLVHTAGSSRQAAAALCPDKATGQFTYLPDCRKFINCWKGRGFIQACAPGTLFNPRSLECDFPAKVRCLPYEDERESESLKEEVTEPVGNVAEVEDLDYVGRGMIDVRVGREYEPPLSSSLSVVHRTSSVSQHLPVGSVDSVHKEAYPGGPQSSVHHPAPALYPNLGAYNPSYPIYQTQTSLQKQPLSPLNQVSQPFKNPTYESKAPSDPLAQYYPKSPATESSPRQDGHPLYGKSDSPSPWLQPPPTTNYPTQYRTRFPPRQHHSLNPAGVDLNQSGSKQSPSSSLYPSLGNYPVYSQSQPQPTEHQYRPQSQYPGGYPQQQYPGTKPQYSGTYPQYPGNQQYPASYPQSNGNQQQYPGIQPQYPGSRPQYPGNFPQSPGSYPQSSGTQLQYPGNYPESSRNQLTTTERHSYYPIDTRTSTPTPHAKDVAPKHKADCSMPGGSGVAPHPTDCQKYLNCWKGSAHTQTCGPGTLFNPVLLSCDHPYNVICDKNADSQEPGPGKKWTGVHQSATTPVYGGSRASTSRSHTPPSSNVTPNYPTQKPDLTHSSKPPTYNSYPTYPSGYGSNPSNPPEYGSNPSNPSGYGSNPSNPPGYGSNPSYPSGYGSNPSNPPGYGSNPSNPPGYGSNPSNSPGYGSNPSKPPGYGSYPSKSPGYGGPNPLEYGSNPSNPPGYGSNPSSPREYGSNPSNSPGYESNPSNPSGYGSSPSNPPGYGSNPSNPPGYGSNPFNSPGYGPNPPGYGSNPSNLPGYGSNPSNPPGYGSSPSNPPGYGSNPSNPTGSRSHPPVFNSLPGSNTQVQGLNTPSSSLHGVRPSVVPSYGLHGFYPPSSPSQITPAAVNTTPQPLTTPRSHQTPTTEEQLLVHEASEVQEYYAVAHGKGPKLSVTSQPPIKVSTATKKPTYIMSIPGPGNSQSKEPSNATRPNVGYSPSLMTSGQTVRLRGGPGPFEGYVEVQGSNPGWGLVCDESNGWNIDEASVVCRQLGYIRGAELSWQGRPVRPTDDTIRVSVSEVKCSGSEDNLSSCRVMRGAGQCLIPRDAVGVRCYRNHASVCQPEEINHGGKCYSVIVPREDTALEAFSHGEALSDCQKRNGKLLDITSQAESDFISELLLQSYPHINSIITSGVGVKVMGHPLWIWEGSGETFRFQKWWPGWTGNETVPTASTVGERMQCVVAKRVFPCQAPYLPDVVGLANLCEANYFYWATEDCSVTHDHPYVCERPQDNVGCVINAGEDYMGVANVSTTGASCIPWDSPLTPASLKYRMAYKVRQTTMAGHNHCRNVGGGETHPWCYVGPQAQFQYCDIPECQNDEAQQTTTFPSSGATPCGLNEFECGPGECIPATLVCNSEKDCSNGNDENDCPDTAACRSDEFECHPREVVIASLVCNGKADCANGRDELNCTGVKKPHGSQSKSNLEEFECRPKECVLASRVCDGTQDCSNGKDERECRVGENIVDDTRNCSMKEFECQPGHCIPSLWACDGVNDCPNGSDEDNCPGVQKAMAGGLKCSSKEFECRPGECVLATWVCDGAKDCSNGKDEKDCSGP